MVPDAMVPWRSQMYRRRRPAMDAAAPPDAPRPLRADLVEVARFFLLWRGAFFVVGYATLLLTLPWSPPSDASPRFLQESFVGRLFFHFDAGWFVNIAENGYLPGRSNLPANTAFWPGFPLLMGAVGRVIGSTLWAGVLVANVALYGALVALKRLGDGWIGPEATRRTMIFYAVFPTSFYLSMPYSDALFLCFATASFLAYRRDRFLPAALLGMLAAFTRAAGIFLGVAYVLGWLRGRRWRPFPIEPRVLWFALVPLGVVAFMLICWHSVGDPLSFAKIEGAQGWDRRASNPVSFILRRTWELFEHAVLHHERKNVIGLDLLNHAAILGSLALLPVVWRRLGFEATVFTIAAAILPLTTNVAAGAARYSLSLFPGFLALGAWAERPARSQLLVAVMAALLPLYLFLYMSGAVPP